MRLGIFGGTFDPIHHGHLLLAEYCREACRLDQISFVPAALAPHKQQVQTTDSSDRVAMLGLAIAGNASFVVSEMEIDRGGVSYTVETLRAVAAEQPEAELFFLMGGRFLARSAQLARACRSLLASNPARRPPPRPNGARFRLFKIARHCRSSRTFQTTSSQHAPPRTLQQRHPQSRRRRQKHPLSNPPVLSRFTFRRMGCMSGSRSPRRRVALILFSFNGKPQASVFLSQVSTENSSRLLRIATQNVSRETF